MRVRLSGAAMATVSVAASILAFSAPAHAAAGQTTFYANADFTGSTRTVASATCPSEVTLLIGHFQSVVNQPGPGCRTQVYTNITPNWVTLCYGAAVLPAQLRYNPEVRVVAGVAPPCT